MSMDTLIFYRDAQGVARGTTVREGYPDAATNLVGQFGQSRHDLVEWVESQHQDADHWDTHEGNDHEDRSRLVAQDVTMADQIVFITDDGTLDTWPSTGGRGKKLREELLNTL